jgi:hypothetical protein
MVGGYKKNDLSNFFYSMRMYPALPFPTLPRSIIIFSSSNLLPKYHYADQVKEDKVGGACGTHGRGEKSIQGFGGKARRNKVPLKREE